MPRFFYPAELAIGHTVTLPDQVAHHIRVLRLNTGDPIFLFNGDGGFYVASLSLIEKKRISAEVKTFNPGEVELPYAITLAQALPESSKMDWIIEKAVELGVYRIQALSAQRCVTRLSAERAEKRLGHWQGIIQSASEQCGRNRLTQMGQISDLTTWVSQQDMHRRIMLCPEANQSLADWARHHPPQAVTLMIGPEGGFTEQEQQLAIRNGVTPLSMGPRILRTETAGLSAIATLNAMWDHTETR